MSAPPRRIVTGHDASGKSVVLSDTPTPKTLDIGTAAFHEVWITDRTPADRGHGAGADRPSGADAAAGERRDGAVHRAGARRRVADAPHGDGRRRRRARGRDVAAARRRLRDARRGRRRGRPARDEPRVGEPVGSPRAHGVRDDRRHDHRRRPRRGRAACSSSTRSSTERVYAARWRAKPGVDSTRRSDVMHSAS